MKKLLGVLLLLPLPLAAQNAPAAKSSLPNGADMQVLLQKAFEISGCAARADQQELSLVIQHAQAVGADIRKSCAAGERGRAQQLGVGFGRELEKRRVVQEAEQCMAGLQALIPALSLRNLQAQIESGSYDVCNAAGL